MKKLLCILLTVATALSVLLALPVSAADSELTNVARGCTYSGSEPYTTDADKYPGYREIDGKELTDGVKGSSSYGTEWYALYSDAEFQITVDLGSTVGGICSMNAEFEEDEGAGISYPDNVAFYGSADNKNFTYLGKAVPVKGAKYTEYTLELNQSVSYRYIRMTIERGTKIFVFVSEIEIWAGYVSDIAFNPGATTFFEGETVRGTHMGVSAEEFLATLNSRDGVTITGADGKAKTGNALLGTGDVITKKADGGDKTYTVIVDGDTNGDGDVTIVDYLQIKADVLGTRELKDAFRISANTNLDDDISIADYLQVKGQVLGNYDLYEKYPPIIPDPGPGPEPEDGRGDVTEEFKDMDVTDNIKTLTEWDMTLKRTQTGEYTMTCKTEDGADLTLTFISRPWGTFNLGAWRVKDDAGTHAFTTGSTDMEYVYRVRKEDASGWVWSGGNHANEKMTEMKFYNEKGEEFTLNVGDSVSLKKLRIVEKTKLYNDPAGDDGKYNYDENLVYATAVRDYTIVGPQIRLAVDYDYLKDTYYQLSYTCMLPIEKKYGLYCAGIGKDGKLAFVYETTKKGIKPDYSGTTWKGKEAVRCIIFGYDQYEPYKIDVRVLTPDTSINNNKSKLMFWDMNSGSNKLYYSKYEDGSYTKEAANTLIHTECQWTYYKTND